MNRIQTWQRTVAASMMTATFAWGFAHGADLPIAHDVDVLVLGGTGAAVEAALAAAEQGASVFLAAPRPYLGEDTAGRLRFWMEPDEVAQTPLAEKMFGIARPTGLPFTYTYDTPPPTVDGTEMPHDLNRTMLNDGVWNDKAARSALLSSSGDAAPATVTLDLGSVQQVNGVNIIAFANTPGGSLFISGITMHVSTDGVDWTQAGRYGFWPVQNPTYATPGEFPDTRNHDFPLDAQIRYIRLEMVASVAVNKVWLGEIIVKGTEPLSIKPNSSHPRNTPLSVKHTLDKALIDAGIRYITGTFATDAVLDEAGQPLGAVMLNRSGRFVVRAKTVIDATESAQIARSAGAPFNAFVPGTYPMTQVVISGDAPQAPGLSVRAFDGAYERDLPSVNAGSGWVWPAVCITGKTYACTMQIPLADDSPASLAAAQQTLRDATHTQAQLDVAEMPFWTPPNTIVGQASSSEAAPAPDAVPLAAFKPQGKNYLYVLGARADVSRAAAGVAGSLGCATGSMVLGRRIGIAAAADAAARGGSSAIAIAPAAAPQQGALEVREHFGRLTKAARTAEGSLAAVAESLPVFGEYDVVVVGGGSSGSPAAISAARAGRSVVVLDFQNSLGGVATVGQLCGYYHGNDCGFSTEIDNGVKAMGGVLTQAKAEWFRRQIREAGGDIRFGTFAYGAAMTSPARIGGVAAVGPDGRRGVIKGKVVIDATGNSDIAAAAGAPTEFLNASELSVQGSTMNYRPLGDVGGRWALVNIDIGFSNDTDGFDMFFFPQRARQTWRAEQYWDQSQHVNSRERRRIVGDLYLEPQDFMLGRTFPDTIVLCKSTHDTHGQATHDLLMVHGTVSGSETERSANLPYRALLPSGVDGMLVTGLGISAHRDAIAVMRMQRDVQNMGYAAGYAASLAVLADCPPSQIAVNTLQQHLVAKGIIAADVLSYQDNLPLPDARFDAAVNLIPQYGGYMGTEVLLTDPARAIPRLRAKLQNATAELDRARLATTLALFGDDVGAADIHAPLAAATALDTSGQWNFVSMPAFGRKLTHFDTYMIFLGRIKYSPALPDIQRLAATMNKDTAYSHFRAVALSLEGYGDTSSVPVLSALLAKDEIRGHAISYGLPYPKYNGYSVAAGDVERRKCLRELCLARALYRLGDDVEKTGETILRAYAADPRSAYAAHAAMVLDDEPEIGDTLDVTAAPSPYGVPFPNYGLHGPLEAGEVIECVGPAGTFEKQPGIRVACTGFTLFTNAPAPLVAFSGTGLSVSLTNETGWARLCWNFADSSYKIDLAAGNGGSVSTAGGWFPAGGTVMVTAVPDEDYSFVRWDGDVPEGQETVAELSFTADTPRTLCAVFKSDVVLEPMGTIFVSANGDGSNGLSWNTAYHSIADGLAAAQVGDIVLVSNGIHQISETLVITNEISLVSLSGPEETVIQVSGSRGIHVTSTAAGALVAGFTVRGGGVNYSIGGNILMESSAVVSNCFITAGGWGTAWIAGAGIYASAGLVTHCRIYENYNANRSGAGVWLGNSARLVNSLVYGNENAAGGSHSGGGVYAEKTSIISNCTVVANKCATGGGVSLCDSAQMVNTIVTGNTLYSAPDRNNLAFVNGANVSYCCVQPATGLTGAGNTDATPNLDWDDPLFRPLLGSSCIDAGVNGDWMVGATDLAGKSRVINGTVDIGAVEFVEPNVLACGIAVAPETGVGSVLVTLMARVAGPGQTGLMYYWDFDNDGAYDDFGTDLATITHLYHGGIHSVKLRVENDADDWAEAVLANAVMVAAAETFVVETNPNAAYPYASWDTAATNILDAVGAVVDNGTVWVTNGFYTVPATVTVNRPLSLRSVNGRDVTTLSGNNKVRVVNMMHADALIDGFTVCHGRNDYNMGVNIWLHPGTARNCRSTAGAGTFQGSICAENGAVENCVVDGNSCNAQGPAGVDLRGASTMTGCLIFANTNQNATLSGGGVTVKQAAVVVRNCTIVDNWAPATRGAGLDLSEPATIVNTVIASNGVYNASGNYANNVFAANAAHTANISHSCVWPLTFTVDAQEKIIQVEPRFEDFAARDYRLWRDSPLRDAGLNQSWMETALDLDGNLRIDRETVDIGAFEVPYVPQGTIFILR